MCNMSQLVEVYWWWLAVIWKSDRVPISRVDIYVSDVFLEYSSCITQWCQMSVNEFWTHWGWVMHICVSKLTITGSVNGLLPGCRQTIIWTNGGILLISPLGSNFTENVNEIHTFPFQGNAFEMAAGKWWPFCVCLNVFINSCSFIS